MQMKSKTLKRIKMMKKPKKSTKSKTLKRIKMMKKPKKSIKSRRSKKGGFWPFTSKKKEDEENLTQEQINFRGELLKHQQKSIFLR